MKKLLLVSTAIAGVAFAAAPADAAINMELGGFFRGYGVYADNDIANQQKYDFRRDSALFVGGETTLDNGLTVGAHSEARIANGNNNAEVDEVYAYVSSGYGRVNLGVEDGAAYLLQVAAPSADSNIDGLRTNINAIASGISLDYAQSDFGGPGNGTDRITYLTPKINGFQGGLSYAFEPGETTRTNALVNQKNFGVNEFKNLWEVAARYDGEFQGFAVSAGAGYSDSSVREAGTNLFELTDGFQSWNAGLNVGFEGFSLGGAYKNFETKLSDGAGASDKFENDTWVVGGAYDNGPYHAGVSYLHGKEKIAGTKIDEGHRYTVGGGYTFGPGMTFRGAVAWGETGVAAAKADFTQVTLGTDIQF